MREITVRDLLSIMVNFQELTVFDRELQETVFKGAAVTLHGEIMDREIKILSCSGDLLRIEI